MSGSVGRGKALVYALIALVVGVASYAIGVGSLLGQRAEASALDASAFTVDPPAPLSLVTPWVVIVALLFLTVLAWLIHGFGRALWLLLFAVAAIVVSQLLKQRVLTRPDFFELDAPNTFPSGHMTVFTVVAGGFIWAVSARFRGLAAVFGAVLMGTVAWQLLEYGWHRPSDVLGAQALGVLAFALAAALRLPRGARTVRLPGMASIVTNNIIGVVLTLTGVLLILGGLVVALLAASAQSDRLLLTAGEIALIGSSALVARAFQTISA